MIIKYLKRLLNKSWSEYYNEMEEPYPTAEEERDYQQKRRDMTDISASELIDMAIDTMTAFAIETNTEANVIKMNEHNLRALRGYHRVVSVIQSYKNLLAGMVIIIDNSFNNNMIMVARSERPHIIALELKYPWPPRERKTK